MQVERISADITLKHNEDWNEDDWEDEWNNAPDENEDE